MSSEDDKVTLTLTRKEWETTAKLFSGVFVKGSPTDAQAMFERLEARLWDAAGNEVQARRCRERADRWESEPADE